MRRILKVAAMNEIINAVERGDINDANKMINIMTTQMNREKGDFVLSEYVELMSPADEYLFRNIKESAEN